MTQNETVTVELPREDALVIASVLKTERERADTADETARYAEIQARVDHHIGL